MYICIVRPEPSGGRAVQLLWPPETKGALPKYAQPSIRAWSSSRLNSHGVFRQVSQIRDIIIILRCFHHLILLGATHHESRCDNT